MSERVERQDGIPVTRYQTRFTGVVDVPSEYAEELYLGKVTLWLVACRNGEFNVKAIEDGDEALKKGVQKLEAAIPLTGELRNQAVMYFATEGHSALTFQREVTKDTEEIDNLAGYLLRNFREEIGKDGSESAVQVATRLLDRLPRDTTPALPGSTATYERTAPANVDPETGEIHAGAPEEAPDVPEPEAEPAEPELPEVPAEPADVPPPAEWEDNRQGTIGSIHTGRGDGTLKPPDGLTAAPFRPEDASGETDRRTVGHVGSSSAAELERIFAGAE